MINNLITPIISVPISMGELVDKITILNIKKENITDSNKLKSIIIELELLENIYKDYICNEYYEQLKNVNKKLWVIEDRIRDKERLKEFDNEFIELSRSVYFTNDERCRIKKNINTLYNSVITEEKSYQDYK
jgi:hypothetical protein